MRRGILIVLDSFGIGGAGTRHVRRGGTQRRRQSLADIGETVAAHLGLEPGAPGKRF